MKRNIKATGDGSFTLFDSDIDEPFHSLDGAIQESMHVFIKNGFNCIKKSCIKVLEFGFGSGLNMLLSFKYASILNREVFYHTVEKFPLQSDEYQGLNYPELLNMPEGDILIKAHQAEWNADINLAKNFILHKALSDFRDIDSLSDFDLVYFDAFSPEKQPELWTSDLFVKIYDSMAPGGIWVSYCSKGSVKRNLVSAGFRVKKLPGPPGKWEMLRAIKI